MNSDAGAVLASRPKLLIVDDHPINVTTLYEALSADHQVFAATSGAAALQVCRTQSPDLVLLDIQMPDLDGHEVCRRLKADATTRDIPIIFITARDDPADEVRGLALGAADFITKPFNRDVVRARVRTHLSIEQTRSMLAATLEATAEGILVRDPAGGVRAMNTNFVRMWGLPPALLTGEGRARHETIVSLVRDQGMELERDSPQQDELAVGTHASTRPDIVALAGDRHFERHSTGLRINGRPSGQVFCFRDVTDRRRAELALERLVETLESRIVERTVDLEKARRQADAANQAKSDFLAQMSHEIRTPLNGVIGMALMALQAGPDAVQRRYLDRILASGRHLLGILNSILDFSKIEAGMLRLEEEDFELAKVFDHVADQMAGLARDKGLGLAFHTEPGLPGVWRGDALRLGQILLNFVDNAIKFTNAGDILVTASLLRQGDSGCVLRLAVRDTGIGMTEAQAAASFQPFQQADSSASRKFGGAGLGLAICRQLAMLMGGEVGVESRQGEGSTFWFTACLRLAQASSLASAMQHPPRAHGVATGQFAGARVLLAEDNAMNLQVAQALLERGGAVVRTAHNGLEAIALLSGERFDCVLTDVQMPVMDGLQVARLIRQNAAWASLPVIALTGSAAVEDRQHFLEAGMDDVIVKPVEPERLYAALARWLEPPGLDPDAGAAQPAPQEAHAQATACAPMMGPRDPEVIDLDILARNVSGNADMMRRYVRMYAQAIPETVAELEAALGQGDLSVLADLGHRLKSSAKLVGAMGFAALCESLERQRDAGNLDEAHRIVSGMTLKLSAIKADIASVSI